MLNRRIKKRKTYLLKRLKELKLNQGGFRTLTDLWDNLRFVGADGTKFNEVNNFRDVFNLKKINVAFPTAKKSSLM